MSRIHGFPPIAGPMSRVLILGSMPGMASLAAGEYYAHPRNVFWPVMGSVLGFDPSAPYGTRVQTLVRQGVAVWDVLKCCVRRGSLDSSIQPASMVANNFRQFFLRCPQLRHLCFNGSTAETLFQKLVAPKLGTLLSEVNRVRLPSTSPAHATLSVARKSEVWRASLVPFLALE